MIWVIYTKYEIELIIVDVPPDTTCDEVIELTMKAGLWTGGRAYVPGEKVAQPLSMAPAGIWNEVKRMPEYYRPDRLIHWEELQKKANELPDFLLE